MKTPRITEQTKAAKKRAFLAAFVETCSITYACKLTGIHRDTPYAWLEEDPEYAASFEKAKKPATDRLIDECVRAAFRGIQKPVIYKGKLCTHEVEVINPETGEVTLKSVPLTTREYSDNLKMFLIKAWRPEFRDSYKAEISGANGGPIDSRLEIVFVKAQP